MEIGGRDGQIRLAAFSFLDRETMARGEVLPREVLRVGFDFEGTQVGLIGPQGIFKPKALRDGVALTITTAPELPNRPRPYEDELGADGFLRYRYRGSDPMHHENVGLRRAMTDQVPLIYLHGVAPGWYIPQWPVFIVGDDPHALTFTVAVDDPSVLRPDLPADVVDDVRRSYATRLARQRLHQSAFRHRVLVAYETHCAVCSLRHGELLDAAHIVPDSHPRGLPVTSNGLALCKLHHSAFDVGIIGIRPDLMIEVRPDVLDEVDGPMLRHGLQDMAGNRLRVVPTRQADRPDPELLELRYDLFRNRRTA